MSQKTTKERLRAMDFAQTRVARFLTDYIYNGDPVANYCGDLPEYDYTLPGGITAELKTDFISHSTGNFAVQYASTTGPGEYRESGISVTVADVYLFCSANGSHFKLYEIPTDKLKNILPRLKRKECNKGATYCYLLPVDQTDLLGSFDDKLLERLLEIGGE